MSVVYVKAMAAQFMEDETFVYIYELSDLKSKQNVKDDPTLKLKVVRHYKRFPFGINFLRIS